MSKGKLLAICVVWLALVGVAAVSWRLVFKPSLDEAKQREQEAVIAETSGDSKYRHTIDLSLDPFSGYAVLRSDHFRDELAKQAIRVRFNDDNADYAKRIGDLQSGAADMAVFTIDALIKSSAQIGQLPGVIVAMIDETRGADAIVAAKSKFPNVNALNTPETRFVLTADSPSETLARVVMYNFDLTRLAAQPFEFVSGPEQVVSRYRDAPPNAEEVYVLWEPFVSEILQDVGMHVVQDSSAFRGYIVDVLVANRDFLRRNEAVVQQVIGSYLVAAYTYRDEMASLVQEDARRLKSPLSAEQAGKLVGGINWKNTLENFAHFGLLDDPKGRRYIEDMIIDITNVLLETGAIQRDPTEGEPAKIFNQRMLASLKDLPFHPNLADEQLDQPQTILPKLSDQQWLSLRQTGDLRVPSLVFAPGTARLTSFSKATLDRLIGTLKTWPDYYLLVRGNASSSGNNPEANRRLAQQRAEATVRYLIEKGVHPSRLHAVGADPSGSTTVSFVLGTAN